MRATQQPLFAVSGLTTTTATIEVVNGDDGDEGMEKNEVNGGSWRGGLAFVGRSSCPHVPLFELCGSYVIPFCGHMATSRLFEVVNGHVAF